MVDLNSLNSWIGAREAATDYITIPTVHRLAATLDRDDPLPRIGDPLPLGWYGVLFPRVVRQSQVGPDGHPERGDFLPPVPLPRRMNGGKRVRLVSDLRVGDEVQRESTIQDLRLKEGQTGQMVLLTVKTDISSSRGLAVTEEQDIIYRDEPTPGSKPKATEPAPQDGIWHRRWTPDPVMLFRYSAVTFNGHRIHYDHPYVTKTEGYPERIVNGGLSALLIFELVRQNLRTPVTKVAIRNRRAMFVAQPLTVFGKPGDDGSARFWITDNEGTMTVEAELTLG